MTVAVSTLQPSETSSMLQEERYEPPSSPCIYKMPDGGIYWYEEETVEEEEEMGSELDYTEVTFESECPTEDDILLGTLPPVPPLAETSDFKQNDALAEQKLLEVLRKKRDEEPKKTTVPGTGREQQRPLAKQKKLVQSSKVQQSKKDTNNTQYHSPIGVWEYPQVLVEEEQETANQLQKVRRRVTSPRVKKIDAILLRHDDRRAFCLHSADPRQQMQSLQKFWLKRINHQMGSLDRQLDSLEKDVLRTEYNLAHVIRKK